MIILKMDAASPDMNAIRFAAESIRAGELVIFPTETVYGLAADALNENAVRRAFEAKGRVESNPLPVQIAGIDQLAQVAADIPEAAKKLAARFWPGPLTMVFNKADGISDLITAGTGKVGIRVPNHSVALAFLREIGGPIIASSANRSGEPAAISADEAVKALGDCVSFVLDSGATDIGVASTVVDITVDPPVILRLGAIAEADILQALDLHSTLD